MPWHLDHAGSRVYVFIPRVLTLLTGDQRDHFLFMFRCSGAVLPLGLGDTSLATTHGSLLTTKKRALGIFVVRIDENVIAYTYGLGQNENCAL